MRAYCQEAQVSVTYVKIIKITKMLNARIEIRYRKVVAISQSTTCDCVVKSCGEQEEGQSRL